MSPAPQYGEHNWAHILRCDKEGQRAFHEEVEDEDGELEWVPTRTNVGTWVPTRLGGCWAFGTLSLATLRSCAPLALN